MSPEQVGNSSQIDHRTDIYSLGVVLYQSLTRQLPFQADTLTHLQDQILHQEPLSPRSVNNAVPRNVERICLKCLAKSPMNRYATAQEVAADLSRCLRKRSKRAVIGMIGLLGMGLLLGLLTNALGHSTGMGEIGGSPEIGETPPSDLSQDISGTWSGTWENSNGIVGQGMLSVKEQPDKTIVGWLDKDYKIEDGRRVGRDEIRCECGGQGNGFQVMGKIKDRGRTLLLLYSGISTESGKHTAFVGLERLTREGAEPFSEPPPTDWSGEWSGKYANTLGEVGDLRFVLKDAGDGTITVRGNNTPIFKGVKINNCIVRWEEQEKTRLIKLEGQWVASTLRLTYTVIYPPDSNIEGFTGISWFIRD